MALDAGFVAAVLEGIEGTLGELIERVETSELQASLDVLQSRVTALRVSIEPPARNRKPSKNPKSRSPRKLRRAIRLSCPTALCPSGQPQQFSRKDASREQCA